MKCLWKSLDRCLGSICSHFGYALTPSPSLRLYHPSIISYNITSHLTSSLSRILPLISLSYAPFLSSVRMPHNPEVVTSSFPGTTHPVHQPDAKKATRSPTPTYPNTGSSSEFDLFFSLIYSFSFSHLSFSPFYFNNSATHGEVL